jgi:hypothetical protein
VRAGVPTCSAGPMSATVQMLVPIDLPVVARAGDYLGAMESANDGAVLLAMEKASLTITWHRPGTAEQFHHVFAELVRVGQARWVETPDQSAARRRRTPTQWANVPSLTGESYAMGTP